MSARVVTRARVVAAGALVVVGVVFGWAAGVLFRPPPPLPQGASYSVVEVRQGELSRSVNLSAAASWAGGERLVNQSSGVLTQRRVASGDRVGPGAVVYTVNLAPVAVAVGEVPAFRDLVPGLRGADVTQLQQMLIATGHRTAEPDGHFSRATVEEYRGWQRASGYPVTGAAPLGNILFVSSLPAVVDWIDTTTPGGDGSSAPVAQGVVGAKLNSGDVIAQLLPSAPSFTIDLPPGQRRLVEVGMPVALGMGPHQWMAVIGSIAAPREDGSAVAKLIPVEGQDSICGQVCDAIPAVGVGSISARITVLAPIAGLVVPGAALAVAADGSTAVVGEDGEPMPVTVTAIVGGQALVEGVPAGTKVRAPGKP